VDACEYGDILDELNVFVAELCFRSELGRAKTWEEQIEVVVATQ
jgi:hypothetical protein